MRSWLERDVVKEVSEELDVFAFDFVRSVFSQKQEINPVLNFFLVNSSIITTKLLFELDRLLT